MVFYGVLSNDTQLTCCLATASPCLALKVPKAWLHKIDDMVKAAGGKPFDDQNRRLYAAMTLYMDAAIGEAVEALKKKDGRRLGEDGNRLGGVSIYITYKPLKYLNEAFILFW